MQDQIEDKLRELQPLIDQHALEVLQTEMPNKHEYIKALYIWSARVDSPPWRPQINIPEVTFNGPRDDSSIGADSPTDE